MAKKDNKTIQDLKRRLLEAISVLSAEGVLDGSDHLSAGQVHVTRFQFLGVLDNRNKDHEDQ